MEVIHVPKRDFYEVLGVRKDASDSEIKKAYRRLAKRHHPDINPGNQHSEKLFKEITESYNVLSDTRKRELYDRFGHAAFDGSMGETDADAFDLFGHNRGRGAPDMTCDITISLEEAVLGCEKLISFSDEHIRTMWVKIPAGITEGSVLRLNRNRKSAMGYRPGNILLKVHIDQDSRYTRVEDDIYTDVRIPYTLAAYGGEMILQTLYGPVSCRIPPGSQTGRKLRLKGKGVVSRKNPNRYGDQYITLHVR